MMSVPNRRLLLSGNKLLAAILLLAFLSSCSIFKDDRSTRKPSGYKKHKPVKETEPIDIDTFAVQDTIVEIQEYTEVDLYEKYGSEFRNFYKIVLILPMQSIEPIEDLTDMKSELVYRFINYYGGIQLALEDLSKIGLNLEVEVLNSSLDYNDARHFTNQLNQLAPDLIIGPYERNLLKEIANYGRRKQIPVISPWQSSSKITRHNPFYVQLKPDIKSYYQQMVKNVDKHFIPNQVFVLGRENNAVEMKRIEYLQEVHEQSYEGFSNPEPYRFIPVEEDSLSIGVTAFDSIFVDQFYHEIAVLLPNWSFRDEQFIYSCLRKLNAEKRDIKVHLYGMPIILESDKMGFNLYKSLNVRLVMDGYIDKLNPVVDSFRKRYYKTYNALPINDALEGYDMMMFIGSNLKKHGSRFQYFLIDSMQTYLQTSYRMMPKLLDETIEAEDLESVDYFENQHIDVWQFSYNGFQKMD